MKDKRRDVGDLPHTLTNLLRYAQVAFRLSEDHSDQRPEVGAVDTSEKSLNVSKIFLRPVPRFLSVNKRLPSVRSMLRE